MHFNGWKAFPDFYGKQWRRILNFKFPNCLCSQFIMKSSTAVLLVRRSQNGFRLCSKQIVWSVRNGVGAEELLQKHHKRYDRLMG